MFSTSALSRLSTSVLSRSSCRFGLNSSNTTAKRFFAQGAASGGHISDELLEKLGNLSTQALVDGLWVMGWPSAQIDGARALSPEMKCVGRAVTLQFVPARPDIAQDKPAGGESPEYEAFELCGPNEVSLKNYIVRKIVFSCKLVLCEAIVDYLILIQFFVLTPFNRSL